MIDQPGSDHDQLAELLTIKETANLLRISLASTYEMVKKGVLPSIRIGPNRGSIRISRDELRQYLNRPSVNTARVDAKRIPRTVLKHIRMESN